MLPNTQRGILSWYQQTSFQKRGWLMFQKRTYGGLCLCHSVYTPSKGLQNQRNSCVTQNAAPKNEQFPTI